MSFITVRSLSKTFKVVKRESGLKNAFKSLIKRDVTEIKAVNDISFDINRL